MLLGRLVSSGCLLPGVGRLRGGAVPAFFQRWRHTDEFPEIAARRAAAEESRRQRQQQMDNLAGHRQRVRLAAKAMREELRGQPVGGAANRLRRSGVDRPAVLADDDDNNNNNNEQLPHVRHRDDDVFTLPWAHSRDSLPPSSSPPASLAPTDPFDQSIAELLAPSIADDAVKSKRTTRSVDPASFTGGLLVPPPTPTSVEETRRINRRLELRSADPTNLNDDPATLDVTPQKSGKSPRLAVPFDDDERGLAGQLPDRSFMNDELDELDGSAAAAVTGEWATASAAAAAAQFAPSSIEQPLNPHFLRVRILGPANAGKSTLINHLLGRKVAAVSDKSQTTLQQQLCILSQDNVQVVFRDTAGLPRNQKQREQLPTQLFRSAFDQFEQDDVVMAVVDAAMAFTSATLRVVAELAELKRRYPDKTYVLVLNKADLLGSAQEVAYTMRGVNQTGLFDVGFSISALNHINIDDLLRYIFSLSKPGEWQYPADVSTLLSHGQQTLDVVREKIFRRVSHEVPYGAHLELTSWSHMPDGSLRIRVDVYVQKKNHMKILIGASGSNLHIITNSAQEELKHLWGRPVLLKVFVRGVIGDRHQFEEEPLLVLPSQLEHRQALAAAEQQFN